MIEKLNLATDPFRNRRLPYLISVLVLFVAFGGALYSLAAWRNASRENERAKNEIVQMESELAELNEKGEKVRQSLSAEQEQLMIAGHRLVANKDFSWSRLLSDLESVLPGSVSASRINVENVARDGDRLRAELDFSVLSRDYQGVLLMIQRMNETGIFKASLRGQNLQKSDKFTYSEFTLRLVYTPRAGVSEAPPGGDVVRAEQLGGGQ